MITIRLLGPIQIFSGETAVKVDSRKALALLGYLAVEQKPVSRAALIGLLWPDMSDERARANLSWTLNRLSSLLPGTVQADRASVRFAGEDVWVDLYEIDEALDSNNQVQLEACLKLYHGPLLDGLEVLGCAEFEHWLTVERERCQQRVIALMQRLAEQRAAIGAYADAADILARLLVLDPLREEMHRLRMRLLAWSDQRSAALAQFEQCRRTLRQELGVEPEPETLLLAEEIRRGAVERGEGTQSEAAKERRSEGAKERRVATGSSLRVSSAPLIGRDVELAEIDRMLRDPVCRLVTIVGFGGMGKTRLALAAAERAAARFRDGVAVVALDATDSPALLPVAIADTLGVDLRTQADPPGRLLDMLREREQLFVLDNIEHLVDGMGLVGDILAIAPGLRLLVTSQARLNLAEEWVFDLRGLRLPLGDDPSAIEHSDAVRLFVRQARRVQASFALDDTNRDAVARICRAVWGHPLAIEVAASWVRSLSPNEIAAEIEAGAGLLTATVRDMPARHRSAQSVFSYGWARLSAEEQQAFALLSIFPADFSRDAAGAVLEPLTGGDGAAALALLAALVDKSLLRRFRNGRYVLHNLLRRFAARKLRPEETEAAQARHWRFFADLLLANETALRGASQEAGLAAIGADFANVRAGWLWAADRLEDMLSPALDSMLLFYESRGWFRAGADLFGETAARLATIQPGSPLLGRLRAREGMLLLWLGDYAAARDAFATSLLQAREHSDKHEEVVSLAGYGFTQRWLGDLEAAEQHTRAALTMARSLNDRWLVATALQYLALICRDLGRHAEARTLALECQALFRTFGYRRGIGFALTVLGLIAQDQEDYAEAERLFTEGLALCNAVGDPMGAVIAEHYLGRLAMLQGRHDEARNRLKRALAESQSLGYQWGIIRAQIQLGALASVEGNTAEAKECLGMALSEAQRLGTAPLEREAAELLIRMKDEG